MLDVNLKFIVTGEIESLQDGIFICSGLERCFIGEVIVFGSLFSNIRGIVMVFLCIFFLYLFFSKSVSSSTSNVGSAGIAGTAGTEDPEKENKKKKNNSFWGRYGEYIVLSLFTIVFLVLLWGFCDGSFTFDTEIVSEKVVKAFAHLKSYSFSDTLIVKMVDEPERVSNVYRNIKKIYNMTDKEILDLYRVLSKEAIRIKQRT